MPFEAENISATEPDAPDNAHGPVEVQLPGDVVRVDSSVPAGELGQPITLEVASPSLERVRAFVRASKAENTLRGYQSDWREFCAWCSANAAVADRKSTV